jgi:hypothetical protein
MLPYGVPPGTHLPADGYVVAMIVLAKSLTDISFPRNIEGGIELDLLAEAMKTTTIERFSF